MARACARSVVHSLKVNHVKSTFPMSLGNTPTHCHHLRYILYPKQTECPYDGCAYESSEPLGMVCMWCILLLLRLLVLLLLPSLMIPIATPSTPSSSSSSVNTLRR